MAKNRRSCWCCHKTIRTTAETEALRQRYNNSPLAHRLCNVCLASDTVWAQVGAPYAAHSAELQELVQGLTPLAQSSLLNALRRGHDATRQRELVAKRDAARLPRRTTGQAQPNGQRPVNGWNTTANTHVSEEAAETRSEHARRWQQRRQPGTDSVD